MQAILVCELPRLLTSLGRLQTKRIEKRKLEDNSQLLHMTFESSTPIHGVFGNSHDPFLFRLKTLLNHVLRAQLLCSRDSLEYRNTKMLDY